MSSAEFAVSRSFAQNRDMARKLYPMPCNELFLHPDWVALPVAGRGMLVSALEHFWRSGCKDLPANDDGLFAVVRAHRSTWSHHKHTILKIFADIRPELEAYHRQRSASSKALKIASWNGGAMRKARLRAKAAEISTLAPAPDYARGILPVKEANQTPRPKPADTDKRKRLSDKAA